MVEAVEAGSDDDELSAVDRAIKLGKPVDGDEEIEGEFPRPAVCLKLAFPPSIDPETVLGDTMDSVDTSALEVICDEKEMYEFVRDLMPALYSRGYADRDGGHT